MARGSNQLIVYTPDYSSATTGTNAIGIEIIVRNSVVTEIRDGKADSSLKNAPIPADGFVLSGHGTLPDSPYFWLKTNVTLGEKITIEKDQIIDPNFSVQGTLTKKNPLSPFQFPGGRGAEELVYYDADFGFPTTGTNEFGYEIVVEDGIVVKISGNDSTIPANGFVLSGHGKAKVFLQNATIGAEVIIDNMNVTIRVTPRSYLLAAEMRITEAESRLENAITGFRDIDREQAQAQIDQAKSIYTAAQAVYAEEQWTDTAVLAQQSENTAFSAIYYTMESKIVDGRAVWYHADESSPEQVAATMERLKQSGINMIFLETIYRGYAIYPGSSVFQQNPAFTGWDPLQAFITEGKRLGIEVHAWVHTFYVGYEGEDPAYPRGPVLAAHPEWTALDRNLQAKTTLESNHYYVSPGNPDAQDFLANGFLELADRYDIDGLQLDYIRFPVSSTAASPYELGYSYDEVSRQRVQQELGFDPLDIRPDSNPEQWGQWVKWRQDQVTGFVQRIADALPAGKLLSTAVFPEEEVSQTKFQDWALWAERGYLDLIAPMVYKTDAEAVVASADNFLNYMKGNAYLYVGLGPYLEGFDPYLLNRQIDDVKALGAAGTSSFSLNTISQSYLDSMKNGPYRSAAVTPHSLDGIGPLAQDLIRKIDVIYVPGGGLPTKFAHDIKKLLEKLIKQSDKATEANDDTSEKKRKKQYEKTAKELEELRGKIEGQASVINKEVYSRLIESVDYMSDLNAIKLLQS